MSERTPSNEEWAECKAWTREFKARRRELERLARREWTEDVRRRLGLVAEVHRCRVWLCPSGAHWGWFCKRRDCGEVRHFFTTHLGALEGALAHARSFLPEPPEPEWSELDVLAFEAAWDAVRDQQARFAAALPERMTAVAGQINEALSGLLPEGMRFEWK